MRCTQSGQEKPENNTEELEDDGRVAEKPWGSTNSNDVVFRVEDKHLQFINVTLAVGLEAGLYWIRDE